MFNLHYTDVDYCRYCTWGYRKRTRIWNNVMMQGKLCLGVGKCGSMSGRQHDKTAQRGARLKDGVRDKQKHSQTQLYKIPPALCLDVFNSSSL